MWKILVHDNPQPNLNLTLENEVYIQIWLLFVLVIVNHIHRLTPILKLLFDCLFHLVEKSHVLLVSYVVHYKLKKIKTPQRGIEPRSLA